VEEKHLLGHERLNGDIRTVVPMMRRTMEVERVFEETAEVFDVLVWVEYESSERHESYLSLVMRDPRCKVGLLYSLQRVGVERDGRC
jgi:uncharacterized protein YbaA (DUF1428 family)